ncbi:TPA: HAD family hydrolase [Campylobacter jejuni]
MHGSPTPKIKLVKKFLFQENYKKHETILIGDSINDFEAAKLNQIDFYGYKNPRLKDMSKVYVEKFDYLL